MEAWHDGRWHAYDPDIEVAARDDTGVVSSVEDLARQPDLVRRHYAGHGDPAYVETIVAIYASSQNNLYLTYPAQSLLGPRGQRPGRMEQAAGLAIFILPLTLIAAGGALSAAAGRKTSGL